MPGKGDKNNMVKEVEQRDYKEIKLHIQKPDGSYIEDLADQLQRMADGVDTAVVYSYSTELPKVFDPANPPPPLEPNSKSAQLVHRLYSLRTRRDCTVNLFDEKSGRRRRCPASSYGFQEIIRHQTDEHNRPCHYFCLVEDCMAAFDKVCNAKRHMDAIHSKAAVFKRHEAEKKRKREMDRHLLAARKRRLVRKKKHGKVTKRTSGRSKDTRVQNQGNVSASNTPKARLTGERMRIQPAGLDVSSEISRDPEHGDVEITVMPTEFTETDIERFHSENLAAGKLTGTAEHSEHMEWVAVTGLLDISYWPSKVHYRFKMRR